jgi:recombination protein RecA
MKSLILPKLGVRSRSLVKTGDGSWVQIRQLVNQNYRGLVHSLVDGEVKLCRMVGGLRWVRSKDNLFYKVVTPSTPCSNSGSFQGPDLAADHPIITQCGPVAISKLVPGDHKIITETPTANPEQLSLIIGSLLGDGGFYEQFGSTKRRSNSNLCGLWFSQAAPRQDYVLWKHDSLIALAPGSNWITTPAEGNQNELWRCALNFTRYFSALRHHFPRRTSEEHGHRRLIITEEVLQLLGPLGMAVWYMDDGSTSNGIQAVITASKLTKDEADLCERHFRNVLGCDVPYNSASKNFYFSKQAFQAFRDYVIDYIHPSVAYKMPGGPSVPYAVDQTPGGLFAEEIHEIVTVTRIVKDGSNTRFSLVVPEAGNFLTLSGFVGCAY